MPFVNGKYQPLSDSQIGNAPAPGQTSDQFTGAPASINNDPNAPGWEGVYNDIQNTQQQMPAKTIGEKVAYPFNTVANIAQKVVHHAFSQPGKPTSLVGHFFEDAVDLASVPGSIIAHPIKTAELVFDPKTYVQMFHDTTSKEYWKEHPLLAALNLSIVARGGTAALRNRTIGGIQRAGTQAIMDEASAQVGLASAKTAAEIVAKRFLNPAIKESLRTGSVKIITETIENNLVDRGFLPEQAKAIALKTTEAVQTEISKRATALSLLNKFEHPVSEISQTIKGESIIDDAVKTDLMSKGVSEQVAIDIATRREGGLSKVTQAIFGEQAKTAVGQIYGADTVAKNPAGFLDIENWAAKQAVEKGLRNTVASRVNIMDSWAETVANWRLLNPEERVAYHQNYIRATQMAERVNAMTGDLNVPTKFLPPTHVEAIVQSIKDAPVGETPQSIWQELKRDYGNDVALHEKAIQDVLQADPNSRQGLIEAIQSMGKRSTLSYHKLPEVNAIIKQMEQQTGYRLIEAPQGKPISFAESAVGEKPVLPKGTSDIAATSFRGEPVGSVAETLPYYQTPRAKGFVNFVKDIANTMEVEVRDVNPAARVWEGKIEPSFSTKVNATLDKTYRYAAALGKKGNQDAVIVFTPGKGGGVKYVFEQVPNADAAIASLQKSGISGATVDGARLIVYDFDGSLAESISKLSKELNIKPNETYGTIKLIQRSEYAQFSRGVGDSLDANIPPSVNPAVGESPALVAAKGKLQQLMEKFGLSPNGDQSGSLEAVYADGFTQNVNKILGEKYGATIKLADKTLPLDKLYSWLDRHKNDIMQSGGGITTMHYSVSDLAIRNLTQLGVDAGVAKDIVAIARQSLADIPIAKTGLMEGFVNLLRAKSTAYNTFYKLKNYIHFNSPLAFGFAARKQFKNSVLASMGVNKIQLNFGEALNDSIRSQIQRIPFMKNVPYLDDILSPKVNYDEVKLMANEVLYDINKNVIDYASNPELAAIEKGFLGGSTIQKATNFARSIQDRNAVSRYIGYNVQSHATGFAKGLAEKYGMTLEEALGYKIENGVKTYNNPTVANLIKDNAQAIFHYEPGILTSPLMRTINTIWFPMRFETKVAIQTTRWFSQLSPMSRVVIANSMVHFVNFKNSPEGQRWFKENRNILDAVLDYLLPYADMGETVQSFAEGKVFNGHTGMVGGLPLGVFINILQTWGLIPESQRINEVTGKPVKKQVPKKLISEATVVSALEDLTTFIVPSDPSYGLTAGASSSITQFVKGQTRAYYAAGTAGFSDETPKEKKKDLSKQFKTVKGDYNRFFGK